MGTKKKVRFVEDGLSPLLTLAHYILVVVIIGILKNWIRQSFHSTIEQGELNDPTTSKEYVEFYPYNDGKTNYTMYLIIKKCS